MTFAPYQREQTVTNAPRLCFGYTLDGANLRSVSQKDIEALRGLSAP